MVSFLDKSLIGISYFALTLISLNCLSIYVNHVGSTARSFAYGLFAINTVYGFGGAVDCACDRLVKAQVIFYVVEMSFVLPFFTTEMWIQKNIMPNQEELVYIPLLLGLLPFFSFVILGLIRFDLIELCLIYCCVCISYMGFSTKDYLMIAASLFFYLYYTMHFRRNVKTANILLLLFCCCALAAICPKCVNETMEDMDFPFKKAGY